MDIEKREHLYPTGENVNCCNCYVKQYRDSSKDKKIYYIIQQLHSLVCTQKKNENTNLKRCER